MPTRFIVSVLAVPLLSLAYAAAQWSLQPAQSSLGFTATQAGAQFHGSFDAFAADISFDPDHLETARFDVRIDLASVNTRDSERDDVLRGADLFNVGQWPTGHYHAEKFTDAGVGSYAASGQLTLRDIPRAVPIRFTFEKTADAAWLKGSATLNRLDFGVGQGDWKDTSTVANEVQIHFALLLK
jgi:polyisoprenoid-binding protein YceI